MRGLGKGATLVLLNGRRLANFGLADGAQYTFVNIDSIPSDIIDRIEILKDGASALYGSDAMAGVINIITRQNYEGVGASAFYQTNVRPDVGGQTTVAIVAGKGNFAKDGYNVFANLEYYQRDGYKLSQVKDYFPEWHKRIVSPAFGDPSLVSYPGNFFNGTTRFANPNCPTTSRNSAGACVTNVNGLNQWSDPAERLNLYAGGRLNLGKSMTAFADLQWSKTQTDYLALPFGINSPATPFRWFDGNAKTVRIVNKPLLPTTNPLNTIGRPMGLEYRFMDPGISWEAPATGDQYRVLAGLNGTYGNWDWEASVGRVGAKGVKESLAPHSQTFISAIESGEYKIGGNNSPDLLKRMFRSAAINGENHQDHVDAKVTGDLLKLPAGALQAAFGAEIRRESVKIKSVDDVMNAALIGRGALWVEGERTMQALYAEFEGPIIKGLTANVAGRYDKADGFSGRLSPKFGLRWEASPQFLLRGTAAGGFRAPNIPETLGKIGVTGFFNGTYDPKRCDTATAIRDVLRTGDANDRAEATSAFNSGCSASVPAMISANPKLEPELSRSMTLGFVFQPVPDFSVSLDYFRIERRNEISYRDPDYVLAREDNAGYKDLIARVPINAQDLAWAARAQALKPAAAGTYDWTAGQLVTLLLQYENFGKTETSGIDVSLRGRLNAVAGGTLRLGLDMTYALTMREWDIDAGAYRPNRVGNRNAPRLKAVASADWTRGPWTLNTRLNHTSSTTLNNDETDLGTWSEAACTSRLKPGDLPCVRRADVVTNMGVVYRGVKNLRLSATVFNVFGKDVINLRDGYSLRPRAVKVGAEYVF